MQMTTTTAAPRTTMFVPTGFRFRPTEQELLEYFLPAKKRGELPESCPIVLVELLDYSPAGLVSLSRLPHEEDEWFFFCQTQLKHKTGPRAQRTARDGYWKSTSIDKKVKTRQAKFLGMRKSLVYYTREAMSTKTSWILHEYRPTVDPPRHGDWVVCKLFRKGGRTGEMEPDTEPMRASTVPRGEDHQENQADNEQTEQQLSAADSLYAVEHAGPGSAATSDPVPLGQNQFVDIPQDAEGAALDAPWPPLATSPAANPAAVPSPPFNHEINLGPGAVLDNVTLAPAAVYDPARYPTIHLPTELGEDLDIINNLDAWLDVASSEGFNQPMPLFMESEEVAREMLPWEPEDDLQPDPIW